MENENWCGLDSEELEEKKEAATDSYHALLQSMYQVELRECIEWFEKTYPKRKIEWFDGNGDCFWVLDDEILYWECMEIRHTNNMWDSHYVDAEPDRRARKLLPLWKFYQSINDMTNVCATNISVGLP